MSEARKLLQEFIVFVDSYEFYSPERKIIWEIATRAAELLAQPEQEPVDWEKKKKSYLDEIDRLGMESNKDEEEIDRLTQLLAQPDQENLTPRQGLAEFKKGYARAELDLKREPLSTDKIWSFSHLLFFDAMRQLEKAHGIGVDDV
jgi:hypothetical protein